MLFFVTVIKSAVRNISRISARMASSLGKCDRSSISMSIWRLIISEGGARDILDE
jgi:hypothetical protein